VLRREDAITLSSAADAEEDAEDARCEQGIPREEQAPPLRLLNHVIVKLEQATAFNMAVMPQKWMIGLGDQNTPWPRAFRVDPRKQTPLGAKAYRPGRADQVIVNPGNLQRRKHTLKAA